MAHNIHGLSHLHKRKRVTQKLEPYPNPNKWKNFMDKSILVVAIGAPILTLPQIIKIWLEKNASGVSALTWFSYMVAAVFWLIYGIMHKEKPIIVTYSLWIIIDAIIVVGTLVYS